ncbi:MAG: hypothetical protein AB1405_17985 [Bdellovibrionota bacterium]
MLRHKLATCLLGVLCLLTVASCGDDSGGIPAQYAAWLKQLQEMEGDIQDEGAEDFLIPLSLLQGAPELLVDESEGPVSLGATVRGSGPVDLGAGGWVFGLWSVHQETVFTGTILVGFRDGDTTEALVVLTRGRYDGDHEIDLAVYVDDLDADDLSGHVAYGPTSGTLSIAGTDEEPELVFDRCPARSPGLRLERAGTTFQLSGLLLEGGSLADDVQITFPAAGFADPAILNIFTYRLCNDADFLVAVDDFPFGEGDGFRDMEDVFDFGLDFCFEMGPCDGDLSNDRQVIDIPVTGATDDTSYEINIIDAAAYLSGVEEPSETFSFYCDAGAGCDTAAEVEAGLIAAINDPAEGSRLVTASQGESIVLTANSGGWPIFVDFGGSPDLGEPSTLTPAGFDLQALNWVLANQQFFFLIAQLEGAPLPDDLLAALPEDPLPNQGASLDGHLSLGCNNYPDGRADGTVHYDVASQEGGPFLWLAAGIQLEMDYNNCEIQLSDGEPFGLTGRPTFILDGHFIQTAEFDGFPGEGTFILPIGMRATGSGFLSNTAPDPSEGDTEDDAVAIWVSTDDGPLDVNVDTRLNMFINFDVEEVLAFADGGLCTGSPVSRNFDFQPNDSCVEAGPPNYYAAPMTMVLLADCSLNPLGGGLANPMTTLALAVGGLFVAHRRRRKVR